MPLVQVVTLSTIWHIFIGLVRISAFSLEKKQIDVRCHTNRNNR